jgi:sec-independent protein translocase protein TatA
MSLFDQPWHIIILLLVVLLLFGSSRLPGAARALGESMNIFKKSIKGHDDPGTAADGNAPSSQATFVPQAQSPQPAPPAQLTAQAVPADAAHQAQLDDLQRQIQELQRLSATGNSGVSDAPASSQN